MKKKLIFGMVLSLLLVSGSFFILQAMSGPGSKDLSTHSATCSLWDSHCGSNDADMDTIGKQEGPAAGKGLSENGTNKKDGVSSDLGRTSQ